MSAIDSLPEGYERCNCHPETCCCKDGMIFTGRGIPTEKECIENGWIGKLIDYYPKKAEEIIKDYYNKYG